MDTKNIDTISAFISTGTKVEGKDILSGEKLVGIKMKSDGEIEFEKKVLKLKNTLLELEKSCPFLIYSDFCTVWDGILETGHFTTLIFDVNAVPNQYEDINKIIEQCNEIFFTSKMVRSNILKARGFDVHLFGIDFGFGVPVGCIAVEDGDTHPVLLLEKIDKNTVLTDEKALELKEALVKLEEDCPTVSYDGCCDYIFDVNATQDMEVNKIIKQCVELFMVNKIPVYHNIIKAMDLGIQVFAGKCDSFGWLTACVRVVDGESIHPVLVFM